MTNEADVVVPVPAPSIAGVNEMLIGGAGSGKTHSVRTLIDTGITPFVLFTEQGMRTLSDIPCPKLHWHYVAPRRTPWLAMQEQVKKISSLSFESMAKMSDPERAKNLQFADVINTLGNFKCDRCGHVFGDITTWGTDRALVLDSLSGVNPMVLAYVVGDKPVISPGEWMVAQKALYSLIEKITADKRCHFILIVHPERETDEVTGGVSIMASTLGKRLAPQLPRLFDDVIFVYREGTKFFWSTAAMNVDLKSRNLPILHGQAPSFVAVIDAWKKAGGRIEAGQFMLPAEGVA